MKMVVTVPKYFCDSCDRQITEAKTAAVVYPNFTQSGSRFVPLYVHKNFVHGDCLVQAQARVKAAGARPGWEELSTFLAQAIGNAGMDAVDVDKILDRPDT